MMEQFKLTDDIRPTCSCGEKMKLKETGTPYWCFNHWECCNTNCVLRYTLDRYEPEEYEVV